MTVKIIIAMAMAIVLLFAESAPSFSSHSSANATTLVPLQDNDNWLSKPLVAASTAANNLQAAVSGDNVYLVWELGGVFFAKSSDGGNTFSSPTKLAEWNQESGISQNPRIAVFQNNIYIVYTSGKDIFLLRSTDSGKTFSSPINVSKMGVEDDPYAVVSGPLISVSDGGKRVYVAWGVWLQLYFAQSADGGANFSEHNYIGSKDEVSGASVIASSGKNVYLIGQVVDDNNIYHISFAKSNDWGHSFQSISNISANDQPYSSFEPQVVIGSPDGSIVYLAWRDEVPLNQGTSNLDAGIAFAKSTDSGKTFNITRYVGSGLWPALAVSGKNIYIASGFQENGLDNIGFVESLDGGKTFSKQIMLSNQTWALNPHDDRPYPAISSDGANVFVSWRYTASGSLKDEENHETFLAASYDEGRTFTRQLGISASKNGDTRSQPVVVAVPVDRVFVFWPEDVLSNNTTSKEDILLSKGQIPEEYTEPYKQVSVTPVEPYTISSGIIGVLGAASISAGVAAGLYYRHKKKERR